MDTTHPVNDDLYTREHLVRVPYVFSDKTDSSRSISRTYTAKTFTLCSLTAVLAIVVLFQFTGGGSMSTGTLLVFLSSGVVAVTLIRIISSIIFHNR
jgi:hypothetical protein